jgi:hypothetical protein
MIFPKEKLLQMGGIRPDPIKKWERQIGKPQAEGGLRPRVESVG